MPAFAIFDLGNCGFSSKLITFPVSASHSNIPFSEGLSVLYTYVEKTESRPLWK